METLRFGHQDRDKDPYSREKNNQEKDNYEIIQKAHWTPLVEIFPLENT